MVVDVVIIAVDDDVVVEVAGLLCDLNAAFDAAMTTCCSQ